MRTLAVLLLLFVPLAFAGDRPVRFSVIEGWAMPLAQIDEGRLTGGILFDLFDALTKKAGIQADYRLLPRARVAQALESHDIDVRCYISPTWLEQPFPDYRWSVPLLTQRDLLVSRDGQATGLDGLSQQTIGTVLGYRYPPLQTLLDSGQIRRDDARTQELVLKKLEIGRYRYAVSSELALHWFNRALPEKQRLHPVVQLDQTDLSCMVLDDPQVPTRALLDALAALKQSGDIERILAHYR